MSGPHQSTQAAVSPSERSIGSFQCLFNESEAPRLNHHAHQRTLTVQSIYFTLLYVTSFLFLPIAFNAEIFRIIFACIDRHKIVLCPQSSVIMADPQSLWPRGGATLGGEHHFQVANPSGATGAPISGGISSMPNALERARGSQCLDSRIPTLKTNQEHAWRPAGDAFEQARTFS